MSDLSIKVSIGGRIYPITVSASEEDKVRAAAVRVEENLKQLQNSYAVKDKQDLLAMTALQFATQSGNPTGKDEVPIPEADLDKMEKLVKSML